MTPEKIENGVVAALAYTLTVDGEIVEEVTADDPLEYLHGAENIVPGLENALLGKRAGDKFSITLQPEEAYGEYDEQLIDRVPLEDVDTDDELEVGMIIGLEDEEGDYFEALIRDITPEYVELDFNPTLAGKVITYNVEVIALRDATEDERQLGIPMSLFDMMLEEIPEEDEHNHLHH
ncbi:MAG: peptidylprolyl isomerase [Chloroflexi bacterium]|nr:MAG: peptidylprolyl isomerase [Chloroflexota bacterium]